MRVKFLLYIVIISIFSGCSVKDEFLMFHNTPAIQPQNKNRAILTRIDPARFEYKIQPHDRLSIMTYRHPELSTSAMGGGNGGLGQGLLVSSSGDIRVPLINTVHYCWTHPA